MDNYIRIKDTFDDDIQKLSTLIHPLDSLLLCLGKGCCLGLGDDILTRLLLVRDI